MKVEIQYIRSVGGCLNEHVLYEELEFKNKTQMMKHVRETKKKIASESKLWNTCDFFFSFLLSLLLPVLSPKLR